MGVSRSSHRRCFSHPCTRARFLLDALETLAAIVRAVTEPPAQPPSQPLPAERANQLLVQVRRRISQREGDDPLG